MGGLYQGLGGCVRDGLFPLPVEEKTTFRDPWKAPGGLSGCARDGLFPLPVKEKSIFRPWEASAGVLAMDFSFCLSRKSRFSETPWKALGGLGGCARNGLFPLPVEEKSMFMDPLEGPGRP